MVLCTRSKMQGTVRIKNTSWISEMGHICHGWTFGTWTASAPQRLSLNKEEEIQNLKMFHPGQKLETSVTDELLATWTAPWDPQEAGQGDSLTVAGYCMVSHVTAWYYMVSYKVLQGPVSPQETPRSRSGHLDKVTVRQLQTLPLKVDVGGNVKQGNVKKKLTNQKKKCWNTKHIASQWLDQWTHQCM